MPRIRSHLSFANVVSVIALFVAISGGTAVALNGQNTVQSDDLGPGAQVKAPDVAANAVNGSDVVNESLTGADIKNRSGVDTCQGPLTARYGSICAHSDSGTRDFSAALNYCAGLGLRLPSVSEAVGLAKNYDVPGVDDNGVAEALFWTDEETEGDSTGRIGVVVHEGGSRLFYYESGPVRTVCVTDPSA